MSQEIRRELISRNLGIKPINHGQIHTFQIALPESSKQPISLEQRQAIEKSLLAHQSNLVSLIIRRTDAYDDEEIEYELVYGANWLQIAQELDIAKVWAWVFDMTDEQASAAIAEMESLSGASENPQPFTKSSDEIDSGLAALIDQKLQLATDSIKSSIAQTLSGIKHDLDEKLKILNYRMDSLSDTNNGAGGLEAVLEKLDTIQQQLASRKPSIKPIENPINLLEASEQDIEAALKQIGTQPKQIRAAIEAIRFWKQSEQGLTWNNLEYSAKAKGNSPNKIAGFAEGAFARLQAAAYIPE